MADLDLAKAIAAMKRLCACWCMVFLLLGGFSTDSRSAPPPADQGPWPVARAQEWQRKRGWLVGCNFSPSTAINQLEMWQAATFDLPTIDRELGWAEGLGFNSVRVFLHDLLWRRHPESFLKRIEQFLAAADKHKIGVVFVLFDSCWDPFPCPGRQHAPHPGLHNSGWVQSPGLVILRNLDRHDELKDYVTGVVGHFHADSRIHAWDLFNEPDNRNGSSYGRLEPANKPELALSLLRKEVGWARSVNPSQPLTAGVWAGDLTDPSRLSEINRFLLEHSDVISFHNYKPLPEMKRDVEALKCYGRPLLCTEYMARPVGSRFDPIMSYLKSEHVGAYNWGFVSGKTQTIYPWDSWQKPYAHEPAVWFHDIFRADGAPFDPKEVEFIRMTTGVGK